MRLDQKDREIIKKTYKGKLKQFPSTSPKAVFWNDFYSQFIRFKALAEIADLSGKKVLDVGSGLGDFSFYLRQNYEDKSVEYLGIDIVSEMILEAKKKYPEEDFREVDIYQLDSGKYDYVFASGLFSVKVENYREKYFDIINQMYKVSKKGIAFNMLDNDKHVDNEIFVAWDKAEVKEKVVKFAKRVKLITGYHPHDFTLYLYKF